MEMEDEILEELATQERLIAYERAERRKAEEGKEKAEAEKVRLENLLKQAGIAF
jgi:DNA-binding protein H-NS